jgi:hypothetical protein
MTAAVARFKLRAPKPEAFVMADGTIALHLEEAYDAVRSALGDRMTETATLLQVDATLDGVAMKLASRSLMSDRGYQRDEGTDSTIEAAGKWADAYLARCRPGGVDGKSENPRLITSDNVTTADAPYFTNAGGEPGGAGRSDRWIDSRADLAGGHGGSLG